MAEHLQLPAIRQIFETLESLLGAALANRELDLVRSYATVLEALRPILELLEHKSRGG